MESIIFILITIPFLAVIAIIAAFVSVRKQIHLLKKRVFSLEKALAHARLEPSTLQRAQEKATPEPAEAQVPTDPSPEPEKKNAIAAGLITNEPQQEPDFKFTEKTSPDSKQNPDKKISFERNFGARLPVWIGGIALALAGVFLVKYSLDSGLLSPMVRVTLSGLFGLTLLGGGHFIRTRPDMPNGTRISQALSGAGIAVLYGTFFSASNLYELLPDMAAFFGMALVTAVAVGLSLLHGPPIALLGLVGGFLTPVLIPSDTPSATGLFSYLILVYAGTMFILRRQGWWKLALLALGGSLLWVAFWAVFLFQSGDGIVLALFLIVVCAVTTFASREAYQDLMDTARAQGTPWYRLRPKPGMVLNLGGWIAALLLMALVLALDNYKPIEWGLFWLLSAGTVGLAFYNGRLYGFAPWLAMIVNLAMLFTWWPHNPQMQGLVILGFGLLFAGAGAVLMWLSRFPASWAALTCISGLAYYLTAYVRLHRTELITMPYFWGGLAFVLCGLAVAGTVRIFRHYADHPARERVLAFYIATATALFSIAVTIEMDREFLSVVFAAQALVLAWINERIDVKALPRIIMAVAAAFVVVLLPQFMLLADLTAHSLTGSTLNLTREIPMVRWPLFQLGIPACLFLGAGQLLRGKGAFRLERIFEIGCVTLLTIMAYYLMRHAFHTGPDVLVAKAGFMERGIITNAMFLGALACLMLGRRFRREAFSWCGLVLCGMGLFRVVYFDLFLHNPLFIKQAVGSWPVLNLLWLPFGLPIAWCLLSARELAAFRGSSWPARTLRLAPVGLLLILVSLLIRQLFHGADMRLSLGTSDAEFYTYSVVWLLLGVVFLVAGTWRKNITLRAVSLGLMILTVAKVFLLDAAELEGLYRVFSFLGLGLSLLGLSWFYTRFVFRGEEADAD